MRADGDVRQRGVLGQYSQEDQIAKHKGPRGTGGGDRARNDTAITFDQLQNVSQGGIFKDGFGMLYLPGANGIPGTGEDTTTLDRFVLPGPTALSEPLTMCSFGLRIISGRF